jgi:predicted Holliday junction resolvase-like endonuclease
MALALLSTIAGIALGLLTCFVLLRGHLARRAEEVSEAWQDRETARRTEASIHRSHAVLRGQMIEQLVPMFEDRAFAHLADARFLGKPVDFIVFDGYTEVKAGLIGHLREIVFIDIKTGRSQLNPVERRVRNCVEDRRVRSVVIDRTPGVGG